MSQLRAMRREFRAAFAVAAVCALLFSLLVSGAVRSAHAFAGSISVACDHSEYLAGSPGVSVQDQTETQRRGAPAQTAHKCPDCCLAPHANSAVLPGRVASVARPASRPATIHHSAVAAEPPESLTSSGANGARAPPSI
ncbi:MAG: hypothetical protein FJX45_18730 [Alphaproteobacteria bacterium]|nr:hypothetical protein [Alphaproteobacteria bacterium]MBM3653583.1 hypothetical protein [Alphaproteobacteria bacterium]